MTENGEGAVLCAAPSDGPVVCGAVMGARSADDRVIDLSLRIDGRWYVAGARQSSPATPPIIALADPTRPDHDHAPPPVEPQLYDQGGWHLVEAVIPDAYAWATIAWGDTGPEGSTTLGRPAG